MNIYSHNSKGFDRLGVNDKKQDTNVIINAICFAVFFICLNSFQSFVNRIINFFCLFLSLSKSFQTPLSSQI